MQQFSNIVVLGIADFGTQFQTAKNNEKVNSE